MVDIIFLILFFIGLAGGVKILRPERRILIQSWVLFSIVLSTIFAIGWKTTGWLHSMASLDPVRQEWQPRVETVEVLLFTAAILPWFFTNLYYNLVFICGTAKCKAKSRV